MGIMDMDTLKNIDFSRQEKSLRPFVQVRLASADNIFFGSGKARLMETIERTGSLQEACKEMGLSYSKGSHMIKNTERQLGIKLVERWAGGSGGGGSRLTGEGKYLLRRYQELCRRVQADTEQIFPEYFPGSEEG